MGEVEVRVFTGLNTKADPCTIPKEHLTKADNIDLSRELGVVRQVAREGSVVVGSVHDGMYTHIDMIYQNSFTQSGLIVKAGEKLWDDQLDYVSTGVPVKHDLNPGTRYRFLEIGGWVVCVSEDGNIKYKPDADLRFHGSYTHPFEADYLPDSDYAYVLRTTYYSSNYTYMFGWERSILSSAYSDADLPAIFYTSSVEVSVLDGTNFSTVQVDTDTAGYGDVIEMVYSSVYGRYSNVYYPKGASVMGSPATTEYNDIILRFSDHGISQGVSIQFAKLELYEYLCSGSYISATIYGVLGKNPNLPEDEDDADALTLTSASDGIAPGYTSCAQPGWTTYDDIAAIIEEIVGQSDYESTDDILLVIRCSRVSTDTVTILNEGDYAAKLEVHSQEQAALSHTGLPFPVKFGIDAPDTAASAVDAVGSNLDNADYHWKYTYYNGDTGMESNPSPAMSAAVTTASNGATVTVTRPSDPQVTKIRLYRTEGGGADYKLLASIDPWDNTYSDDIADTALGAAIPDDHDPPPAFSDITEHKSLVYGIDASNKSKIWYSNAWDEWEHFDDLNYEYFGKKETDESVYLETLAEYFTVVQKSGIWRLKTDEDPEEKSKSLSDRGILKPWAACHTGEAIAFVNTDGIFLYDAVRDIKISLPVDNIFDKTLGTIDEELYNKLCIGYNNDLLFISYPEDGELENSKTLIYHMGMNAYVGTIAVGFTGFCRDPQTGTLYGSRIYTSSTYDKYGAIVELFAASPTSVTRAVDITTKHFSEEFGSLGYYRGVEVFLDMNPDGSATVNVYLDSTLSRTKEFTDSTRGLYKIRIDPDRVWQKMYINITTPGTYDKIDFKLYGLRVVAEEVRK